MTLRRRLERVEAAARSPRVRADVAHLLGDVLVPETGDRLAFVAAEAERALGIAGDELEPREAMAMLEPLFQQLTLDEMREVAEQWGGTE